MTIVCTHLVSFGWRKFSPENSIWNTAVPLLSYSCMFQVEISSQELEICKSVCMFILLTIVWDWLTFGCFVPMIADHDLVKKRSTIMNAEASTHTFLTMIIEESVRFMSCEPFFCVQLFLCGTHGIYIYIFVHQHER